MTINVPRRHNLHEVGMLQTSAQIVSTQSLAPKMGARLRSYVNNIDEVKHPSPLCPLCKSEPHTTIHMLNCTNINTQLHVTDLWTAPMEVGRLLFEWRGPPVSQRARIPVRWGIPSAGVRRNGCWTPPPFFGGGVGPTTTWLFGESYRSMDEDK